MADFRSPHNIPEEKDEPLDNLQKTGHTFIADGVPEVIKRTREALRMGAFADQVYGWRRRSVVLRSTRCHGLHLKCGLFSEAPTPREGLN
jgi:hypothetical protein